MALTDPSDKHRSVRVSKATAKKVDEVMVELTRRGVHVPGRANAVRVTRAVVLKRALELGLEIVLADLLQQAVPP